MVTVDESSRRRTFRVMLEVDAESKPEYIAHALPETTAEVRHFLCDGV